MISSSVHSSAQVVQAKPISAKKGSNFQTFRQDRNQEGKDFQKLREWLKGSSQAGLRCWRDDMGCMRRINNSYVFDPKGQVVTVSVECFDRLVE